ncbi:unnamed protein product [Rotaria sp. Silwood2]|nr:unnamed protein product [Rotaria sp. Silwood2]CAF4719742.1 unnamed protein product [Rotaria sp. Silwood2]
MNTANVIQNIIKRTVDLISTTIGCHVKFRREYPNASRFDMLYDDLVAQPIETVRRLYNHFGLAWSNEFETAMLAWLRDNPQGKQGRNPYALSDYGIILDDIKLRYNDYISMFLNPQPTSHMEENTTKSQAE